MVPSLPIVRTTLDAYLLVWRHRRVLLTLGWPLAIVIVVPQIVMPFFFAPQVRVVGHLPPGQLLIMLVWTLVWIALAIPTATSAYRLFIRGSGQRLNLRFSHEEWLYIGASFRLAGRTLLLALPMLIVMGIAVTAFTTLLVFLTRTFGLPLWAVTAFAAVAMVVIWLAIALVVTRYTLVLPAAAIGHRMRLAESARIAGRNALRMMAAYFLTVVVLGVVGYAVRAGFSLHSAAPVAGWVRAVGGGLSGLIGVVSFIVPIAAVAIIWLRLDADSHNAAPAAPA